MRKMSDIPKEHLKANEDFFESVFKSLNEGGLYFYSEASCVYQKKDNKFYCSMIGYSEVKKIVSHNYLIKRFFSYDNN